MTTAANWFASADEFRRLCCEARAKAHKEAALEFTHDLCRRADQHGLDSFLTAKQLTWLCQIAGAQVPHPIEAQRDYAARGAGKRERAK